MAWLRRSKADARAAALSHRLERFSQLTPLAAFARRAVFSHRGPSTVSTGISLGLGALKTEWGLKLLFSAAAGVALAAGGAGCAGPSVIPGQFVGSAYVNRAMGYAFQVPSGWVRREEERYKRNELALSPANALETVIFAGASVGATPELTRLGGAPRNPRSGAASVAVSVLRGRETRRTISADGSGGEAGPPRLSRRHGTTCLHDHGAITRAGSKSGLGPLRRYWYKQPYVRLPRKLMRAEIDCRVRADA